MLTWEKDWFRPHGEKVTEKNGVRGKQEFENVQMQQSCWGLDGLSKKKECIGTESKFLRLFSPFKPMYAYDSIGEQKLQSLFFWTATT
jgi:hypothetical protein